MILPSAPIEPVVEPTPDVDLRQAARLFALLEDHDALPAPIALAPGSIPSRDLEDATWHTLLAGRLPGLQQLRAGTAGTPRRPLELAIVDVCGQREPLLLVLDGQLLYQVRYRPHWLAWFEFQQRLLTAGFAGDITHDRIVLEFHQARVARRRTLLFPPTPICGSTAAAGDRVVLELRAERHERLQISYAFHAYTIYEAGWRARLNLAVTVDRFRPRSGASPIERWQALERAIVLAAVPRRHHETHAHLTAHRP